MTDGHCSNSWGVPNDATNFWHAFRSVSADLAGSEGDADFVPYAQSMVTQQSMGYFVRTTTRTPLDSNLVINSAKPTIPIPSKTLFPFVGDVVDKVGARTGGNVNGLVDTNYLFAPLNNIQAEVGNVPAATYGQ